jgi:hypothetical protein
MNRLLLETPLQPSSLSSKPRARRGEQRFFAPDTKDGVRAKANDRPAPAPRVARYTWVLEHDTLVEQYVH